MLLVSTVIFSQKIIDNPDYGMSSLPGNLTKIELTDSATIIHFYIKYQPGQWIFIPKESYIQDVNGGEKLFVTKTIGIPLGERYTMPESGEVSYQLYFPKLNSAVNKVDFGEANEGGSWFVYDIVIKNTETSVLPKTLQGNWLQANGSNQWDYGFYNSNAIVDKAVWNYKTVEKKKNNYTIVLEREGKQKTIYAQLDKKGAVKLGENKENLTNYSTEKVANPNYKLANDEEYKTMVFKSDSATYSGFIKGYTSRTGSKTGTIYVNNVFTGNQDSYLVKIAEDGSFSVKFPMAHPQYVFVRLANVNTLVFVAPAKETFHYIDRDKFLFMGDYASINTGLNALQSISFMDYLNLRNDILKLSSEMFKKNCLEIKDKQMAAMNAIAQKEFISPKALQIKKLDIEFLAYEQILSYDMYKGGAERNTNPETNPLNNKMEASYYNFITPSILNNELAVVSGNYSSFINRLKFSRILRPDAVTFSYTSLSETAKLLQESGITFSDAELQMLSASKLNDKIVDKTIGFYGKNYIEIQKFKKNHNDVYGKLQKKNPEREVTVAELATSLKTEGVNLTAEEEELLSSFKLSELNKEEIAIATEFNTKYGQISKAFTEKYKKEIQAISDENNLKKSKDKLKTVFGTNESFVFDLFTLQDKAGDLERNFTLYTENELKTIQKNIKHPFLSNYIFFENDKMKAKLEANKTKTGFAVNAVKKTEGDELFDSMIAKFKGKVIYVDFWATWCGPCLQGIKEIATLKEEMQNENVVFLYITGPSSPEKTWNNNIPNIKGEHYRVSEDEWNYLIQKFNISGIPHYVLVNKNGEVVNPKLGHHSNEALKGILEEQMK